MIRRPNECVMPDPLAYFLTWPTYGTWLPGDARGWVEYRAGWRAPDPKRERQAGMRMTEGACIFDLEQRRLVEETVTDHCLNRRWHLYAVNCRSNHVHVVVTAAISPKTVVAQLKSWCTRRLKELEKKRLNDANRIQAVREQWWAERGSRRWINDKDSLEQAIFYVQYAQDRPGGDDVVSDVQTLQ